MQMNSGHSYRKSSFVSFVKRRQRKCRSTSTPLLEHKHTSLVESCV
uniref:Ovule protein n=1 Tax=Heterorhabditis bacteriophora TaxID=37862 RepID=A0A1I7WIY9_HETBA